LLTGAVTPLPNQPARQIEVSSDDPLNSESRIRFHEPGIPIGPAVAGDDIAVVELLSAVAGSAVVGSAVVAVVSVVSVGLAEVVVVSTVEDATSVASVAMESAGVGSVELVALALSVVSMNAFPPCPGTHKPLIGQGPVPPFAGSKIGLGGPDQSAQPLAAFASGAAIAKHGTAKTSAPTKPLTNLWDAPVSVKASGT
jgi:hypothetical protein